MPFSVDRPVFSFFYLTVYLWFRYFIFAMGTYWLLWVVFPNVLARFKLVQRPLQAGQVKRELISSFFNTFVFAFGGIVNFFISRKGWGLYYANISEYGWAYWWLSIFLMILISDIHFYIIHRILHWGPLYRSIHAFHHLSRQTTPLTSQSFHFIEIFLVVSVVFIIPLIMPLHSSAYVVFTFISFFNNIYGHCGYEFWPKSWRSGFFVKWLNTSSVHSWHHEKVHGNYSLFFTFLDRIFGTYKDPESSFSNKVPEIT